MNAVQGSNTNCLSQVKQTNGLNNHLSSKGTRSPAWARGWTRRSLPTLLFCYLCLLLIMSQPALLKLLSGSERKQMLLEEGKSLKSSSCVWVFCHRSSWVCIITVEHMSKIIPHSTVIISLLFWLVWGTQWDVFLDDVQMKFQVLEFSLRTLCFVLMIVKTSFRTSFMVFLTDLWLCSCCSSL